MAGAISAAVPCVVGRPRAVRRHGRRAAGSCSRRVATAGADAEAQGFTQVVSVSPAQQAIPPLAAYRSGGSGGAFGAGVVVGAVGCYVLTGEAEWARRLRSLMGMKAKSGLSKAAKVAGDTAAQAGKRVADVSGDVYSKAKAANPELVGGVEKVANITGQVAGSAAKAAGSAAKATINEVNEYREFKKEKGAKADDESSS